MDSDRLFELRFDQRVGDCIDASVESLVNVEVERNQVARDPTIVAALTVVGAAVSLTTELIKLVHMLREKGKRSGVELVKIDERNDEASLPLLEASEAEIKKFVDDK